jgi:hypothetical protein
MALSNKPKRQMEEQTKTQVKQFICHHMRVTKDDHIAFAFGTFQLAAVRTGAAGMAWKWRVGPLLDVHPHVFRVLTVDASQPEFAIFEVERGGRNWVGLLQDPEYCGTLTEADVMTVFAQVVSAVGFCHEHGMPGSVWLFDYCSGAGAGHGPAGHAKIQCFGAEDALGPPQVVDADRMASDDMMNLGALLVAAAEHVPNPGNVLASGHGLIAAMMSRRTACAR